MAQIASYTTAVLREYGVGGGGGRIPLSVHKKIKLRTIIGLVLARKPSPSSEEEDRRRERV